MERELPSEGTFLGPEKAGETVVRREGRQGRADHGNGAGGSTRGEGRFVDSGGVRLVVGGRNQDELIVAVGEIEAESSAAALEIDGADLADLLGGCPGKTEEEQAQKGKALAGAGGRDGRTQEDLPGHPRRKEKATRTGTAKRR